MEQALEMMLYECNYSLKWGYHRDIDVNVKYPTE